jgi:hypothetical protein
LLPSSVVADPAFWRERVTTHLRCVPLSPERPRSKDSLPRATTPKSLVPDSLFTEDYPLVEVITLGEAS